MALTEIRLPTGVLSDPSRFLLDDECAEDYGRLRDLYVADLAPANALERRQVELILRCDLDIERQYRMIQQKLTHEAHIKPRPRQIIDDFRAYTEMDGDGDGDDVSDGAGYGGAGPAGLGARPPEPEPKLNTPDIARAYTINRAMIDIHQRELNHTHRRRRQEIELLFKMQDRRRRPTVHDAEIIEVG